MATPSHSLPAKQQGAALVEFALVLIIFVLLVYGSMVFSIWLYTVNAAQEATRLGARLAAVCSPENMAQIKTTMALYIPHIDPAAIRIDYLPSGCNVDSCQLVSAYVEGGVFSPNLFFLDTTYPFQGFSTTLPRERMNSSNIAQCL